MSSEQKQKEPAKTKKKTGLYVIGAAVLVLIAGYFVLSKANADASNWAGILSPFLIIGGYITIAAGIMIGWDE